MSIGPAAFCQHPSAPEDRALGPVAEVRIPQVICGQSARLIGCSPTSPRYFFGVERSRSHDVCQLAPPRSGTADGATTQRIRRLRQRRSAKALSGDAPTAARHLMGQSQSMGSGGAEGNRTPGLIIANDALYQLSYGPTYRSSWGGATKLSRRADQMDREKPPRKKWKASVRGQSHLEPNPWLLVAVPGRAFAMITGAMFPTVKAGPAISGGAVCRSYSAASA
jgi:hypothetical protein